MNRSVKYLFIYVFSIILALTQAASAADVKTAVNETAAYIFSHTPSPAVGSVGGEWAVLGLARSDYTVPDSYYNDYYSEVCRYASEHNGILTNSKYTEYSRVIIALTAIGKSPLSVAGYDLTAPLSDLKAVTKQGLNGSIWALIALDCGGYTMPLCHGDATQATREGYIKIILDRELPGGGWSLTAAADTPDIDVTAMALQALAKYRSRRDVKGAVERGLSFLSAALASDGSFNNAEITAQMLTALSELGISYNDPRFIKDGKTVLDMLLSFRLPDGSFAHNGTETDMMATEQALYALVSAARCERGEPGLHSISGRNRFVIHNELLQLNDKVNENKN